MIFVNLLHSNWVFIFDFQMTAIIFNFRNIDIFEIILTFKMFV